MGVHMVAILVVLFVIAALVIDSLVLSRRQAATEATNRATAPMHAPEPPQGVFVDAAHTWLRITSDGALRVGLDDFLAQALGTVERVDLPAAGTAVERGTTLFTLTVKGRKIAIPSPISGTVVSSSDRAVRDPLALTSDPYGAGWIVSLFTRDTHAAVAPLKIGIAAVTFLRQEFQRLADFLTPVGTMATVPVMADGGLPGEGAAANLPDAEWAEFQKQFVSTPKEA